jgi:hypothetical protein
MPGKIMLRKSSILWMICIETSSFEGQIYDY